MKYPKMVALTAAAALTISMAACSSDDESDSSASSSSSATTSSSEAVAPTDVPTAEELTAVLTLATDPNVPSDQKLNTVQDAAESPEIFDIITQSTQETGAFFEVVDPVLPDYTPDAVLATVIYTLPEREPQTAERVQFVYEDGQWKLSSSWACTLVRNVAAPDAIPTLCQDAAATAASEEAAVEDEAVDAPAADAENEVDVVEQ